MRTHHRILLIGLSLVLVFLLGSVLYLTEGFHRALKNSTGQLNLAKERDSLLLTTFEHAMHALSMGERMMRSADPDTMLDARYRSAIGKYEETREAYLGMHPGEADGVPAGARKYFQYLDSTVAALGEQVDRRRFSRGGQAPSLLRIVIAQRFLDAARTFHDAESRDSQVRDAEILATARSFSRQGVILVVILLGACGLLIVLLFFRERVLTAESRRFRTLLEHSANPVQVLDPDGIIVYVNDAYIEWTGLKESARPGQPAFQHWTAVGHRTTFPSLWPAIEKVLTQGKSWAGEVEYIRDDGRVLYSWLVVSPVVNQHRTLVEAFAMHADLTERREYARRIQETQRQHQMIVENSLEGIAIVQDGNAVFVNPTALAIFGYPSVAEMKRVPFLENIAPASRSLFSFSPEGHAVGDQILRNYELRILRKAGSVSDAEVNALVTEWDGAPAIQASFRDITERKTLEREQALWLWEQETLMTIDRQLVSVVDLQKVLDAIALHAKTLTRADFAGTLMVDPVTEECRWKALRGGLEASRPEPFVMTEILQGMLRSKDPVVFDTTAEGGTMREQELPAIALENLKTLCSCPLSVRGEVEGLLIVGFRRSHKFSDRELRLLSSLAEKSSIALANAELYDNLIQRERELEQLSGARVQAQEEERRRIAREIHDGLGQMLTAIKFNLEILEDSVEAKDEERKRIFDMKTLLDNVMKEAREISYNLMPSVLDDFGLAPALQLLCEQVSNRSNLRVAFHAHGENSRLQPSVEIGLYRIAQEALNNVSKHAGASEATVQLIRTPEGTRLAVEDNGRGLPHEKTMRTGEHSGMGLVSMRERAASFHGTLTIDSSARGGTIISVDIPTHVYAATR